LSLVSGETPAATLLADAFVSRPELKGSAAEIAAARNAKSGAIYGPLIPTVGGQAYLGGLGGGIVGKRSTFGESEDYIASLNWRIGPGGLFDFGQIHLTQARLRSVALTGGKLRDQIAGQVDRKSTRLNSSHQIISYAVF